MQIDYLSDVPQFLPVLAAAIARHWAAYVPGESYARRLAFLNTHKNRDIIPIAWIAHRDGQALGMSALRVCDMPGKEEMTPWLAGVFVMPAHRGVGLASRLCKTAEAKAWALNIDRLYLHTPDQQSLYAQIGWQYLERVDWHGQATDIMTKDRPNS